MKDFLNVTLSAFLRSTFCIGISLAPPLSSILLIDPDITKETCCIVGSLSAAAELCTSALPGVIIAFLS